MKDIPAQYHSFRKTTLGDNILSFRVDQMYSDTVGELVQAQIGTEYVMKLEKVNTDTVLGGESKNIDTEEKFRRTMHARINELADIREKDREEVKDSLRQELIKRKLIEKSTKELDIKGLAIAVNILDTWIKEN